MSAPGLTIPAVLTATVEQSGGRLAVSSDDRTMTWAELYGDVRRFGAACLAAGIEPGDRVAVWAYNSSEWIVAALGLFTAGATLVPINTRFRGMEAAEVLLRSRARLLLTVTDFLGVDYLEMLRSSGQELPGLENIVTVGPLSAGGIPWHEFLDLATQQDVESLDRRTAAIGPDDPSDILFTSGTTGVSKGVVMTHSRTLAVARDWVVMAGLTADDRYLMVNPYFHMFGLKAGILAATVAGTAMLPVATLDVGSLLQRVQDEGVTLLPGPPTLYQSILDHPRRDSFDLSSLRTAVTGSADIPVELIRRVQQELPFSLVVSGYGLTEAGTASSTTPTDPPEAIATTVGQARPGFEMRLIAADGTVGDTGEIRLRGPSVMLGYLDDPDATRSALSADGWLRTGDLGTRDEAGRLRIVGRLKDMFIVGGFNVYPAEIENRLLGCPGVAQAAVIGVPDARLGEVGMAFVVAVAGAELDEQEIIQWSRSNMANYKVPRRVRIVAALPLGATGKVQKDQLRAEAANVI